MDLECPYCEKGLEVCHDDGQGYDESMLHEMDCDYCGKSFVFETSISFYYEAKKADCLNDGKHKYKLTATAPREFSKMRCEDCDEERELTLEERIKYNIGSIENYTNTLK